VVADAGNDQVRVENVMLPTTVEGGDGSDTMVFTGSGAPEQVRLSADGPRAKLTGATAIDIGAVERVDGVPLGGDDTVTLDDLTGTAVQDLRADLAAVRGGSAPDAGADQVIINGGPKSDTANVLGGGAGSTFVLGLPAAVTIQRGDPARDRLTVDTLDGDDRIDASSLDTAPKLIAGGGAGNDTLFGSNAPDELEAGDGADFVDAGRGADAARLGGGKDVFQWEPGDGADTVDGQDGVDAVRLSGTSANEKFAASAAGERVRLSRSAGADGETIDAAGIETLVAFSFGGADTLTVGDLTGTGVTTVDAGMFDFAVPGGANDVVVADATAAADKVTVAPNGSPSSAKITGLPATITVNGLASDRVEVRGLGGDDVIDSTDLPVSTHFRADAGAGDDILIAGDGDDVLFAGEGDDLAFGGAGDDRLRGEDGDDFLDRGADFDVLRGGGDDDVLINGEDVSQD
jgi:Ca2+-binding RTX toxin-like protein